MARLIALSIIALTVLAWLAGPAHAQSPSVGDAAPEFGAIRWALNTPEFETLADYRGDVVVVYTWGVGHAKSEGAMPHMRKLYERYAGKGLQMFGVQRFDASDSLATLYAYMYDLTFPVANHGFWPYNSGNITPFTWVIDVNGTVVWASALAGKRRVLDEVVKREIGKVKYPGLGRLEIDSAAKKAARAFVRRKYSKARRAANKIFEADEPTNAALADARYVMARIDHIAKVLKASAKLYEREKLYLRAFRAYGELAKRFKGEPEGEAADARLKQIKDNDQLKREIVADEAYLVAIRKLLDAGSTKKMVKILREFAANYPGTRAADDAAELADDLDK